jgi:hypothetical protein
MLARLLCRLGVHRWNHARDADGDEYKQCGRCGKDTMSPWAGQLDAAARKVETTRSGLTTTSDHCAPNGVNVTCG